MANSWVLAALGGLHREGKDVMGRVFSRFLRRRVRIAVHLEVRSYCGGELVKLYGLVVY